MVVDTYILYLHHIIIIVFIIYKRPTQWSFWAAGNLLGALCGCVDDSIRLPCQAQVNALYYTYYNIKFYIFYSRADMVHLYTYSVEYIKH